VAYLFPPVGGVGVQRVTKFVKYLPGFGWESSVLTAANPSVPLIDESLAHDVPPQTIIRRARTFEPGYGVKQAVSGSACRTDFQSVGFARRTDWKSVLRGIANVLLQPDAQILWRWQAVREGLRLLREVPHDAIVATGPPFSSFLVGAALSRRTGLPLVLDYRDEWGISNAYWENKRQGRLVNRVQRAMQDHCIRAAHTLLATTPSSAAQLAHVAEQAGSTARARWIHNGFDPADFESCSPAAPRIDYGNGDDRYRLTFVGTLWNLNPIGPVIDGIRRLAEERPHLAERLELVCAGRRTGEQEAALDALSALPCRVVRLPFVSHDEAVKLMRDADALLLVNADLPHTQRIVNAKTFEYMAARRPIFAVAPPGDLWDVVRGLPGAVLCRPGQPAEIARALAHEIERHRCGIHHDDAVWDIARFERRQLAGELADLLDGVAAGVGRGVERAEACAP
jgi:glycosyltransferase involved in cell wall biosynthesis